MSPPIPFGPVVVAVFRRQSLSISAHRTMLLGPPIDEQPILFPLASSSRNVNYMSHKWSQRVAGGETSFQPGSRSYSPSPPYSLPTRLRAEEADDHDRTADENAPLMSPPSHSRLLQLAQVPAETAQFYPTTATISSYPYQQHHYSRQNVVPPPLSVSSSNDHPDNFIRHGSIISGFPSPYQTDVSINPSPRPRTSHPVFHSTSALAAHHGIPQSLPPVPRTTRFPTTPTSVSSPSPAQPPVPQASEFDFLCSNYLSMLSQNEGGPTSATNSVPDVPLDPAAVQSIMDVLQGMYRWAATRCKLLILIDWSSGLPEFGVTSGSALGDLGEFLTSPMDDSPFEDFLNTPAMTDGLLTSPAIYDQDSFDYDVSGALFGGGMGSSKPSVDTTIFADASIDFDRMYTMPSPTSPTLDPTALTSPPRAAPALSQSARRLRKNAPTGTRKNITPETLVPYDAPIQTRKYVTPSATSRKEVPTAFLKKKRAHSQAFGEDDELDGEEVLLDNADVDAIEAKRRQNTLAARRSRKRKLEYQRELEISVEQEKAEKETWKRRAMIYHALLESHGHEVPSFDS